MKNLNLKLVTVLLVLTLIITQNSFSQVLISNSTGTPDASSMLEVRSNSKGMLIPRMTTIERGNIDNGTGKPTEGLLVYDTDFGSFFIYGRTHKGTLGWNDLSTPSGIWQTSGSNVFLSNSYTNVGIGTSTPTRKLVIKANNATDPLFEILDEKGRPLMIVTPQYTRIYTNPKTKGNAGGFAVGRYASAKEDPTESFYTGAEKTRIYTDGNTTKGVAGGFAVGRYASAKEEYTPPLFYVCRDSTRVYTDSPGIGGGFAVGTYTTTGTYTSTTKSFYTDIDKTRVYTEGSGTKGVAGGFAVGRYASAKGKGILESSYMFMTKDNYFIGHEAGLNTDPIGGGLYNLFFGYQSAYTNTIGSFNTFVGHKTGYSNIEGKYNVFLGNEAGYNNLGNHLNEEEGVRNVFLGYQAGYDNTTGGYNVFVGNDAGHGSTTGVSNTFVGTVAGVNNETGNYNTFLGDNAGKTISDADRNTFIGTQAGQFVTSGHNNIFLGYKAGAGIDGISNGGSNNIFLGTESGLQNISGSSNVFLGNASGTNNKKGSWNVFIGNTAGYNNGIGGGSTGSYSNVFIGYAAGYENTTGFDNVYLGTSAGKANLKTYNTAVGAWAGSASTGSYATFLGKGAGSKSTGDNNTYLGMGSGGKIMFEKIVAGAGSGNDKNNVFVGGRTGFWSTTGTNNTLLGFNSGSLASGQNLGSGNLFLGYLSGSTQNDVDNKLFIENSASETPLIYGDFTDDSELVRVNGDFEIANGTFAASLKFYEPNGSGTNFTSFISQTQATDITYTLPDVAGNAGQILTTDASSVLSWSTIVGESTTVSNGLTRSTYDIELGGNLTDNTTITQGNNNMIFNMTGGGDFIVQDNGATALRVFNNGDVGIGTASAATKMHILNSGTAVGSQHSGTVACFQSNGSSTDWSRISIIGGTSGVSAIDFGDGTGNDQQIGLILYDHDDNLMKFQTNGSVKMTLLSNGNAGIGTSAPDMELVISHANSPGNAGLKILNTVLHQAAQDWSFYVLNNTFSGDGDMRLYENSNLVGVFDQVTGDYSALSDKRVKRDITEIPEILEKIQKLKVVEYFFIKDTKPKNKSVGLIAQDVEKIFPSLVNKPENKDDLYTMNYSGFGVLAIKAIQEQQTQLKEQDGKIDNQNQKIIKLEKQIQELKELIQNK